MTYNHEEAKVLCPAAAKEVERLREEVERLWKMTPDYAAQQAMIRTWDYQEQAKDLGKLDP